MLGGVVKLIEPPDDETIESVLEGFKSEVDRLRRGVDLDADIMLSLRIQNEKRPDFTKQKLHAFLRGLNVYTTIAGKRVEYVRESGIYVPADQTIATVQLFTPEQLRGAGMNINMMVKREDEELGRVYAPYDAVLAALRSVNTLIDELEAHDVDVKRFAPEAVTDKRGRATVSFEDVGTYLRRFEHHAAMPLHDNYITSRKGEMTEANITFLPGNMPSSRFTEHQGVLS
jgi:hypothetical protein